MATNPNNTVTITVDLDKLRGVIEDAVRDNAYIQDTEYGQETYGEETTADEILDHLRRLAREPEPSPVLTPESPCEAKVKADDLGGVEVEVFVPTYSGGQTFRLAAERDEVGGDWRLCLPVWQGEPLWQDNGVSVVTDGEHTYEAAGGIVYLGAPDVEVERS